MDIIVLNVGLGTGVITDRLFTIMVFKSLVTTLMTTPVVSGLYPFRFYMAQIPGSSSSGKPISGVREAKSRARRAKRLEKKQKDGKVSLLDEGNGVVHLSEEADEAGGSTAALPETVDTTEVAVVGIPPGPSSPAAASSTTPTTTPHSPASPPSHAHGVTVPGEMEAVKDEGTDVLVCLLDMQILPSMFAVLNLLAESVEARVTPGPLHVESIRLVPLSDRVSSLYMAQEQDAVLENDAVTTLYRSFGRVLGLRIEPHIAVTQTANFGQSILTLANRTNPNLILIPWFKQGDEFNSEYSQLAVQLNNVAILSRSSVAVIYGLCTRATCTLFF